MLKVISYEEMQIKGTPRCRYTATKMAIIKMDGKTKFIEDLEQHELSWIGVESVKYFKYFGKEFNSFFNKIKHILLLLIQIILKLTSI